MLRRRAMFLLLALPGVALLASYLYFDYRKYGVHILEHFLSFTPFYSFVFHVLIFTTPFVSMAFAFIYYDRLKLIGEAKAAEGRYRDYYDNAPYGYHSADGDMLIVDANRTWLDMLGYERSEVVGRLKVMDLLREDSCRKLMDVYGDFKQTGKLDDLEVEFVKKDGSVLPALLSATAVFENGAFARSRTIIMDNSERKTFESILHAVAEQWEDTFNSMPWGVMIIDSRCNVIRFNEYFLVNEVVQPGEFATQCCCPLINTAPDTADPDEFTYATEYHDDVRDKHYKVTGKAVYSDGFVKNYVFNMMEITDIKRGQQKLVDSRNAFFNMLKDASEAFGELDAAYNSTILSFAKAIDAKSPWTKGHSERVRRYSLALGEALELDGKSLDMLSTAALLHDIGKIGTYDYLLEKPDGLTEKEYEMVKRHPVQSAIILEPIKKFGDVVDIVRFHHEQYDGMGYPEGLKGDKIPLLSRILCIADSYDSMVADRPYREAQDMDFAIAEITRCSGTHFDPGLADSFVELIREGKV